MVSMRSWLIVAAVALLALNLLFRHTAHPHFWWEALPGFWAALGFGGAWLLTLLAKGPLRALLEREEDYYDR